jgi:dolichol-phosphate mannosyltransferase
MAVMSVPAMTSVIAIPLLAVQVVLLLLLLVRLMPGRTRRPPVQPVLEPRSDTSVTVVVATLNEARRIGPCLQGLMQQTSPMLEVLVVDSRSTDGTRELVAGGVGQGPAHSIAHR